MKLAAPNPQLQQTPSKIFRAPDGKMRVDSGNVSTIADPSAKQMILLDHVKKEIKILPMPEPPPGLPFAAPALPGMPQPPGGAAQPPKVEELGKGLIEGHPVEGRRFTFQPPETPKPQLPPVPALQKPALPGMPQPPQAPAPPVPPPMPTPPTVSEVWTSSKLKLPVLTKTQGPFGEQVCHCKYSEAPPPPSMFQIPPGYKMAAPPVPPMPAQPAPPKPAFPR